MSPAVEERNLRDALGFEEACDYEMDLSQVALEYALGKLGLKLPELHVCPEEVPYALRINREYCGGMFRIVGDPSITDRDTWFVEYEGRRVGSVGA